MASLTKVHIISDNSEPFSFFSTTKNPLFDRTEDSGGYEKKIIVVALSLTLQPKWNASGHNPRPKQYEAEAILCLNMEYKGNSAEM